MSDWIFDRVMSPIMEWFLMPVLFLFAVLGTAGLLVAGGVALWHVVTDEERTVSIGMNHWQCSRGHEVTTPAHLSGKIWIPETTSVTCDQWTAK